MYKLVARIDNFDPRFYGEFQDVVENGTGGAVKDWMLSNCPVDTETFEDVFEDVIINNSEYVITFSDIMCDRVSLYLI